MKTPKPKQRPAKWDQNEAQGFRDGCRRRAVTFTDRRKESSRRACRGAILGY